MARTADIPLFDERKLKANVSKLGDEILALLKSEAQRLIVENRDDALVLGQDTVKAILWGAVFQASPIPDLPADASPEQIRDREVTLAARTYSAQLVSAAQRQHSERVARIQKAAVDTASKIGGAVLLLGFRAILGG